MDLSDLRASTRAALTVTDVADLFETDERTVRRACENGQLQAIRIGRLIRIPREPLLALLTSQDQREAESATDPATAHLEQDSGGPSHDQRTPRPLRTA